MADIADTVLVQRASMRDATASRAASGGLVPLATVNADAWRALAEHAVEPNGYYLPDWELALDASARGRTNSSAICAWRDTRLTGLLPVISMWRAYKMPLPALVSAEPYGTLCTPLLDGEQAESAALEIMNQARAAGAHALVFRAVALDGPAMRAFREELRRDGLRPKLLQTHLRASLDATRDADELLQDRIVEAIGDAVQEAIRDHKRAGNPIAEWRDGRVVLVPPDQIED